MTISRSSAAVLIVMIVSGCTQRISDEDLICDPSPGLIGSPLGSAQANSFDQEGQVFSCIHKWAYRLGKAPGSNSEIAKATIGKCRVNINQLLAMRVNEGLASKKPMTAESWQVSMTGFEEDALTRVVQGRAGNCSIRGEDQK